MRARGAEAPRDAWEAIYAAEGSDWFWWYGDDHQSDQKEIFDTLFREKLARVYAALAVEPPAVLQRSLRSAAEIGGEDAGWDADRYYPSAAGGAMHRTSGVVASVRHRVSGGELVVRVDAKPGGFPPDASMVLRCGDAAWVSARVPFDGATEGPLVWVGPGGAAAEEGGSYVRGDAVEARIPLARCLTAGSLDVIWRVEIERKGSVEESVPGDGWFRTPAAKPAGPGGARGDA